MKKAFCISIILISTLFLFIAIGFNRSVIANIKTQPFNQQICEKISELHVLEYVDSISDEEENPSHLTTLHFNQSIINKTVTAFLLLSKIRISEFVNHVCLAKYLLFHNLKISHSTPVLSSYSSIK